MCGLTVMSISMAMLAVSTSIVESSSGFERIQAGWASAAMIYTCVSVLAAPLPSGSLTRITATTSLSVPQTIASLGCGHQSSAPCVSSPSGRHVRRLADGPARVGTRQQAAAFATANNWLWNFVCLLSHCC